MATDVFDPFGGSTGLKENYDGTITAVGFFKDPERDNYSAQVTIKADDGDEVEARYSLGSDWASYDGGETVEHPRLRQFNNRSAWWDFVNRAVKTGELAEKVLRERGSARVDEQGMAMGPRDTGIWLGLRFHFDVVQVPGNRRNKETGEWTDKNADGTAITNPRTVPEVFLGIAAQQGDLWEMPTSAPTPAVTVPSTAATATSANGSGEGLGLSPADWAKLTILAKSSADYAGFADAVMGLQDEAGRDMVANTELMTKLSEESFYTGLKG